MDNLREKFSNHQQLAVICNGSITNYPLIKSYLKTFSSLIAVDGGTSHCHAMDLTPDLIIGDIDSSSPEILSAYAEVPRETFPQLKDKTDLELALELLISETTRELTLFGALGKRLDHTLTNCLLLTRYPGKLYIQSETERVVVIDKSLKLICQLGQTLSLIPLNGPVSGIYTQGLKWPLTDGLLDKTWIGISNVAEHIEVTISVECGDLLCCLNL